MHLDVAGRWNNRALAKLMWPLIIEQFLSVSIGLVDTVMVTAVGEAAVSGVSLVDSMNMLIIVVFAALGSGGAVVASQYLGRQDHKNASLAARQLVYAICIVSVTLMALVLVLQRGILQLVYGHIEADVMQNALTYFWLSALSYPFIALYNACAGLFRSMGHSKVSMTTALLINILNIGGNSLLIFGFGLGVAGAAISTLISRAVAALVLVLLLMREGRGPITLHGLMRIKLVPDMIKRILRIGVPSGLENSMFQVGKLMVSRIISTFGTAAIAGNAIANALLTICTMPAMSFGLGMITVVGQCVGAGDYKAARRNTMKLLGGAWATMALLCLLVYTFRNPLLTLFNLSPEAAALARGCIFTFCIAAPLFWPLSFSLPNALRAAGDARYTMVVSVLCMWTFRIGASYLFAYSMGFGMLGVWYAMVVDWVVRGACFTLRWVRGKWQNLRLLDS
ncbi:MATE family efflux transporter [Ruminococcaceae bacterium OttesenSCG-928-O06]|nr:MATE family efflux transporter [Ruminococcaceae bacterium OttesenSCG-928-O06]